MHFNSGPSDVQLTLDALYSNDLHIRNENLRKKVGFFEIENIDKPNVITIALNPKEYNERFFNHSDNKKHNRRQTWILIRTLIVYLI